MSVETMKKMVDWVDENIKENLSLEKMSAYVGYSCFYCSTKFHEYSGMTFKQYISKRRLSLAKIEIRNNNRKILDIALDYGFSSQEAFTRAFADTYGCTPYKYRKKHSTLLKGAFR